MCAIVTGAQGFIGSHLVKRLIQQQTKVIAVVKKGADLWRLNPCLSKITLLETQGFQERDLFHSLKIQAPVSFFHLAWEGVLGAYRLDDLQKSNLTLTQNLLKSLKFLPLKTLVALGSQAEYGSKDHAIREEEELTPLTLYGKMKLEVCRLLQNYCSCYHSSFIWFRLFSCYGPYDRPEWLIPYVIGQFLQNKEPLLTQGDQRWDYLYVQDAVEALVQGEKLLGNHIFNLGSGITVTIKELVIKLYDLIRPAVALKFGTQPFRKDQIMHLQADMTRFFTATSWRPMTTLSEGLKTTILSATLP